MLEFLLRIQKLGRLDDLTEEMISSITKKVCGTTSVTYGEHTLDFGSPWKRLPFTTTVSEATGLSEEDSWEPQNTSMVDRTQSQRC